MNSQVAISNLPLPDDCLDSIKSYIYLDKTVYQNIMIRKSVHAILKSAVSSYNYELKGYSVSSGVWIFRWLPYEKYQYQTVFCRTCGDYVYVSFGNLPKSCRCKCFRI